jgi:Abnormal spindle-like microcephaly-assoc'd, ASPM-SPD-2-Hydin
MLPARVDAKKPIKTVCLLLCVLALTGISLCSTGCVGAAGTDGTSSSGLAASPASVSFGNVNTGSTASRSATITNSGPLELSVSNVSVSGAGFNLTGVPVGLSLTPGSAANLAVTFAPASAGSVSGKATITDKTGATLAISLSGTGVTPTGHQVTLTWSASSSNVSGYRAYRATSPGGPYSPLNSSPISQLQWKDSTVQSGTTYYYVVTAVAANSTESTFSNEATAPVPKP